MLQNISRLTQSVYVLTVDEKHAALHHFRLVASAERGLKKWEELAIAIIRNFRTRSILERET